MRLLLIALLALNITTANAFELDYKKQEHEEMIAQTSVRDFTNEQELRDKKRLEEIKDLPIGECFKKCNASTRVISRCMKEATTSKEKAQCLPQETRECMLMCKDAQLSLKGFKGEKINPHQACFNKCEINIEELKTCRQEAKNNDKDLTGTCLSADQKACLKPCMLEE